MASTKARSICLACLLSFAAASAPCASEDHVECMQAQSVSLLQMNMKVESKSPEINLHASAAAVEHPNPAVISATLDKAAAESMAILDKAEAKDAGLADPAPFFTTKTMPPVSTTLECIINLGTQYFGIYTALAIVRTLKEFQYDFAGVEKVLETGAATLTYAPMLCALFLGSRMRAIQLTQGNTEANQLPQPWVQNGMLAATYATTIQAILVLLVGFLSGMSQVSTDSEGNLETSKIPDMHPIAVQILTTIRYVVMAMLYGSFSVVVYGVFTMEAPAGSATPPVSPAVKCTILLCSMFFLIYTFVAVTKTLFEVLPALRQTPGLKKLQVSAESAKMTVNFAPMISILFIGARMRALQIDPVHGHPQPWAQNCFYACTFSILVQAILVILLPFVAGGECMEGDCEGDVAFVVENKLIGGVLTGVRYACLFGLYVGVSAVVVSVITIESPLGAAATPAVSPAMQCVTFLTTQYFLVYTALFVCITIKSFVEYDAVKAMMTKAIIIFDAGRQTVMFAPMLSCLFIGTRIRALQLATDKTGAVPATAGPQKWVQDCMYLATGAVFAQLVMTMLVSLLLAGDPKKVEMDEDGMPIATVPAGSFGKYIACFLVIVKYANLVSMYFGSSGIVIGVFLMTPGDLQPYNSQGLFP